MVGSKVACHVGMVSKETDGMVPFSSSMVGGGVGYRAAKKERQRAEEGGMSDRKRQRKDDRGPSPSRALSGLLPSLFSVACLLFNKMYPFYVI